MTNKLDKKENTKGSQPDAPILTTISELTYAEILQKIKIDSFLPDLDEDVDTIRRMQKSDLLLELRPVESKSHELHKKIELKQPR